MANNKTPKAAAAKPNAAPSATKGKSESQLQQEAKSRQTPAKQLTKKKKEEEEDSDSDLDDEEEKKVLVSSKKTPAVDKKADPQDEEMDEEDDEDEEDYEDDDTLVVDLAERLRFGFQQGITIPAGTQVLVQAAIFGDASYPFHITNACLGPDAEDDDRACLILQQESMFADDHDHDHDDEDEEEHDHEHDDEEDEDEGELMEIVCGALCKNKTENLSLDLVLNGDFLLVNTSEKTDIYVTGRLLVDEDDDGEYDELEDEEIDEDGEGEISRTSLDDDDEEEEEDEEEESDDDEEEEDKAAAEARRQDVRKRLLEPSGETKKAKVEPKVIDVKPSATKAAASGEKKAPPTAEAVRDFILAELKTKKTIKNTELGTLVSAKFGMAFKQMGFAEKTMTQFLQVHAKGKAEASGDSVKLI